MKIIKMKIERQYLITGIYSVKIKTGIRQYQSETFIQQKILF
jgi:hypothetical protein